MRAYLLATALVIAPFLLFGEAFEDWSLEALAAAREPAVGALVVAGLLCADVVLPVPSSIVSTAAGYSLGVTMGTLASFAGMAAGCLLGYGLGRLGSGLTRPRSGRGALWTLALFRPVPVLAEASVLVAGAERVPLGSFVLVTGLSNLGVSLVYALAGSVSASLGSVWIALLASLVLPGVFYLVVRRAGPGSRAAH